jgi:hypothetical protein
MNTFCFTETMNEVSGFGGFYERCCRAGVCAGAQWCAQHPGIAPTFSELQGVFGLVSAEDSSARSLQSAILAASVPRDDGVKSTLGEEVTGAQMHAIVHHVMYIACHGWKRYVEQMSAPVAVYNAEGRQVPKTA